MAQPDPEVHRTLQLLDHVTTRLEHLRRGDHRAARVKALQANVALRRVKTEEHILTRISNWVKNDGGWEYLFGSIDQQYSGEQRIDRLLKVLFGEHWSAKEDTPLPEGEPPPESAPSGRTSPAKAPRSQRKHKPAEEAWSS